MATSFVGQPVVLLLRMTFPLFPPAANLGSTDIDFEALTGQDGA